MKALHRTGLALAAALALTPLQSFGQAESYHHAKRQQHRSDARHHTKAKIVGGSAAGGGLVANHEREKNDVKKRQEYGTVHPQ